MITNSPKFKRMMTLFTQNGKQGYRHTYAYEASKGRTESTRSLKLSEVDAIINRLEAEFRAFDTADKMRKKMIGIARNMGWELEVKQPKPDMDRLNNWCVKYGQFHKELNKHDVKELSLLITQFEQVYSSFLSSF